MRSSVRHGGSAPKAGPKSVQTGLFGTASDVANTAVKASDVAPPAWLRPRMSGEAQDRLAKQRDDRALVQDRWAGRNVTARLAIAYLAQWLGFTGVVCTVGTSIWRLAVGGSASQMTALGLATVISVSISALGLYASQRLPRANG
jgi:hypothetical protein